MKAILIPVVVALAGLTAGCGIIVPTISELWDTDLPPGPKLLPKDSISSTAQIEFEIKKRIYCDLREAVRAAEAIPYGEGVNYSPDNSGYLPLDWGAFLSISLEVDDSSNITPGVSILNPLVKSQSRNFGFGANL